MIKIYSWTEFPRRIQPSICRFIFPRAISRSIVRRHRRDDLHTGLILELRREEEEEEDRDSRLLLLLLEDGKKGWVLGIFLYLLSGLSRATQIA